MNRSSEPTLARIMHDLTDEPEPAGLADRALHGARGQHRRRVALTGLAALAAVAALSVPFLLRPDSTGRPQQDAVGAPGAGAVAAVPRSALGPCRYLPGQVSSVKRVEPADWPDHVRLAVAKLPARSDYVMQSGYAVCADGAGAGDLAAGYAVINLGGGREHGHLTLNLLSSTQPNGPTTCDAVRAEAASPSPEQPDAPAPRVLFCDEGTTSTPIVYGLEVHGSFVVTARYADNRVVWMESIGQYGTAPTISAEDLRRVVGDPALAALLPV